MGVAQTVLVATPLVKIKNECVVIDVFFSSLSIVCFFLVKKTAKSLMWNPIVIRICHPFLRAMSKELR